MPPVKYISNHFLKDSKLVYKNPKLKLLILPPQVPMHTSIPDSTYNLRKACMDLGVTFKSMDRFSEM